MADDDQAVMPTMQPGPMPDLGQASQQTPVLDPATVQQAQQQQPVRPPSPRPILFDLFNAMGIGGQGQTNQAGRPVSRLDHFENFLGNFVQALGAGFANEGRGPGAAYRGAGAAMQAPYQEAVQRYGMQQQAQAQQAQIQTEQQRTAIAQQQASASPRFDPDSRQFIGQLTDKGFADYLANKNKGATAAGITAQSRMSVEQMKAMIAQGQVVRVLDGKDESGSLVKIGYNKEGQPVGTMQGALPSSAYMPTTSSTVEYREDVSGMIRALPKVTTSGKAGLDAKVPALAAARAGQTAPAVAAPGQNLAAAPGQRLRANTPSGFGNPNAPATTSSPAPSAGRVVMQGRSAADMGVAFNPQTGEREQVSRSEAFKNGFQNFTKATEAEFDRYRSSQVMFNDVQSNVSRYTTAVQRYAKEGRPSDGALFDTIINKSGIAELALKISAGGDIQVPILTAFGEAVSREARSSAYKNLSPAGKSVVDGYFRTMAAVPAYQKALTTIGKLNKETIDLELANIPNPTMAPDDQARKLAATQHSIV